MRLLYCFQANPQLSFFASAPLTDPIVPLIFFMAARFNVFAESDLLANKTVQPTSPCFPLRSDSKISDSHPSMPSSSSLVEMISLRCCLIAGNLRPRGALGWGLALCLPFFFSKENLPSLYAITDYHAFLHRHFSSPVRGAVQIFFLKTV